MSAHTPGPWVVTSAEKADDLVTSTHDQDLDDDVCEVYGGNDDLDEVRMANARLIAAAPDLLAALKALMDPSIDQTYCLNSDCGECHECAARAAIARAEGETK